MFAYIDELDQLLQETQAGRNLQIVYAISHLISSHHYGNVKLISTDSDQSIRLTLHDTGTVYSDAIRHFISLASNNHDIIKTITDEFNYHYFQVGWILQWIRIDPDLTNRDRKVVTVQFLKTGDTVKCC